MIDIHQYEREYVRAEERVRQSTLSDRNKELILHYRDACLLHGVSGKVRLIRTFLVLTKCAQLLGKDYDTATRPDMERVVSLVMQRGSKPATVCTYKAILKRFMGWVCCPLEFPRVPVAPPVVAWMTVHLKKRDEKRLQRQDLLTSEDIAQLLQVAFNPRDKALVSVLWESGGRIGEIGNREIQDVVVHEHGYTLDIDGKTGRRSPLLVSSAPHLAAWLSQHPLRTNPKSPLWLQYQKGVPKPMQYPTIRAMLQRLLQRAGIRKPVHPHIFRHSRATHVLARGIMTDAQARQYFGWTSESNMLGRYGHLVDLDAHNALLKENGLAPTTPSPNHLTVQACVRCKTLNPVGATACRVCTLPTDTAALYAGTDERPQSTHVVLQLVKVLVQQGLTEHAVTAVHDANLGPLLRRLAEQELKRPTKTAA